MCLSINGSVTCLCTTHHLGIQKVTEMHSFLHFTERHEMSDTQHLEHVCASTSMSMPAYSISSQCVKVEREALDQRYIPSITLVNAVKRQIRSLVLMQEVCEKNTH